MSQVLTSEGEDIKGEMTHLMEGPEVEGMVWGRWFERRETLRKLPASPEMQINNSTWDPLQVSRQSPPLPHISQSTQHNARSITVITMMVITNMNTCVSILYYDTDFPGASYMALAVKNSPANAGDLKRL